MTGTASKLFAEPLATWERDGLAAALRKAGLPTAGLEDAGPLFWRFVTRDDVPVGFGGLEVHGRDAVLRSVVTLPPMRGRGFGSAIVSALESEAAMRNVRAIWLMATAETDFFARLGYSPCAADEVPDLVRASAPFAAGASATATATAMAKRL
jgi:N-acetylglutamate synthase-like GNAT family acetyltransferase